MKIKRRQSGTRLVYAVWLFFVLLVALCSPVTMQAQISPGPLSRAHQHLEGVANCASCHDFRAGARNLKCLGCHQEIQRRLTARAGYHARVVKAGDAAHDCARCHLEHNGVNFALIRFDRSAFDHQSQTGFALTGKHRAARCEACHTPAKQAVDRRAEIRIKDTHRSFLGLSPECASCHADQHKGQLGTACARCHTPDAWKTLQGFDHSRTAFPLSGLHASVPCVKCHTTRGADSSTRQFKGLAFGECRACHNDPHRGAFQEAKFRGSCDSCHTTDGFRKVRIASGFNHAATAFPLNGKHSSVACARCHKDRDFSRPVKHTRCADCHEDPHNGQFAARAAGSDCQSCHVETGFKPSRYDRDAHRQAAFRLEGKHASLECARCHQPVGRAAVYRLAKTRCADCHADSHQGQIADASCDRCHTQEHFQPQSFDASRHATTHFPLTGRHATIACRECHKPLETASALSPAPPMLAISDATTARRRFRFEAQSCSSCHRDPHETKIACASCHDTAAWKTVKPFDHATVRFALAGRHQSVACIKCHPAIGVASLPAAPRFGGAAPLCVACHARDDAHAGQFRTAAKADDCASCHAPAEWKQVSFDHDRTRFPFDRAHRNVECARCHKPLSGSDPAKPVRRYRDTPLECVQCH